MRALFLVGLVVLSACREKPAAPVGADLPQRLAARVKKAFPEAKVSVEPEGTVLVKIGETETTLGLDNIRLRCATEVACEEALDQSVKNLRAFAPAAADAGKVALDRSKVLLTLKTTAFLESIDAMMKQKLPEKFASNRLPRTPLAGDLVIVYVLDSDTGMRMISQQDLDDDGLDLAGVDALAKKNLGAMFSALTPMEDLAHGVFTNTKDENYASAMLVLPDLWVPLSKQIEAPMIVAAPARNRLFAVSGKNNEDTLGAFKKVVEASLKEEDHALSGVLLEWTPKGFREWKP
jgi:uncharacterized protein YtpQ (UPF0354 family)